MNDPDRLKLHQTLYKLKTPPWKESFREKCFQRLRSNRSRLVDKFRGMGIGKNDVVDVVMKEEWNSFASKQSDLPNVLEGNGTEVNEYLSILDEIQKELMEEEKRILEEYYAESEAITSTIDWLERDEVICPFCQKYGLHQNLSVIFCRCGFRIDTQQDGFTLENFKVQLGDGLEIHERTCCSSPSFSLLQYCSVTNLAITCEACNFMYLVV